MAQHDYHVYIIYEEGDAYCKIGVSSNPGSRLSSLQSGNPRRMGIYCTYPVPKRSLAFDIERTAHYALEKHQGCGEWFAIDPEAAQKVIGPIWRGLLDDEQERRQRASGQLLAAAGPR